MEWLSPEQVAERLGLHVRTVRGYIRDGRLPAARIGRQYRIAPADLDAFTGRPAPERPRAEVSAVIEVAGVDRTWADRLSTMLVAGAQLSGLPRVQTIYDGDAGWLKVIVIGDLGATAEVLRTLEAMVSDD